jgi:hypothetical protein
MEVMNKTQEQDWIKEMLFEFLRELPPHYDGSITTVREAHILIDNFMQKHGLKSD